MDEISPIEAEKEILVQRVALDGIDGPQESTEDAGVGSKESTAATTTTALTRNIEHLDQLRWMQAIALSAVVRTTLQHPLNVAAARKRVHRDYVPLRAVLAEGYAAGGGGVAAGIRALYRGLGVCIVGNVIGECLYLGALEHTRHRVPLESSVADVPVKQQSFKRSGFHVQYSEICENLH